MAVGRLFWRRHYFGRRRHVGRWVGLVVVLAGAASAGLALWTSSGGHAASRPPSSFTQAQRSLAPPAPTTSVPTAAAPFRVLMIGDSLGEDLGFQLENQWTNGGTVHVDMEAKGDTGLVNQGYYNWPEEVASFLDADHPQLVVAMFAANDVQSMDLNGAAAPFGGSTWVAAYTQRVGQIVTESTAAGANVLWVGEPAMEDPNLNAGVQLINGLDARIIAPLPGAIYLDPNPVLSPGGQFASFAPDSGAGETRTGDGVHLTSTGAGILAQAAAHAVAVQWHVELPQGEASGLTPD